MGNLFQIRNVLYFIKGFVMVHHGDKDARIRSLQATLSFLGEAL